MLMVMTSSALEELHIAGVEVEGGREWQRLVMQRIDIAAIAALVSHPPAEGHPTGHAQDGE